MVPREVDDVAGGGEGDCGHTASIVVDDGGNMGGVLCVGGEVAEKCSGVGNKGVEDVFELKVVGGGVGRG